MAQSELNLDEKFITLLEKMDDKLEKLAQTTGELSASFSSLSSGGLNAFVQQLSAATNNINKVNKRKVKIDGIDTIGKQAKNATDSVNLMSEAVEKLAKTHTVGQLSGDIKEIKKIINSEGLTKAEEQEWIDELKKYEAAKKRALRSSSEIEAENNQKEQARIVALRQEYAMLRQEVSGYNQELNRNQIAVDKHGSNQQIDALTQLRTRAAEKASKRIAQIEAENAKEVHDLKMAYDRKEESTQLRHEERLHAAEMKRIKAEEAAEMKKQQDAIRGVGVTPAEEYEAFRGFIQEDLQRVTELRAKLQSLPKGTAEYQEASQQLTVYERKLREAYKSSEELRKSQSYFSKLLEQSKGVLAGYFSLYAIGNFAKKMVQVTGEFEIQNRSLQAILKNKNEANKLWQQTVDLAVKSPFTVKELVTYTKQLAAYRVETSKLHDTTKMLADVSAGLGVEVNRLVLAYGQVKAANYLRGTELRQFSEAGINILEELAKYYKDVEGRIVSVGQVFEMVSRREVSFGDVEAVLKRITGAGGAFYRMQEIQAETVKGMRSNLQDSFDLMMNDIGQSTEGLIKGFFSLMKYLIDNWKTVGKIVLGIVATYGTMKTILALTNVSILKNAASFGILLKEGHKGLTLMQMIDLKWKQLLSGVKELKDGQQVVGFSNTLKNFAKSINPVAIAITVLVGATIKFISAIVKANKRLKEINAQYDETRRKIDKLSTSFNNANGDLKKMNKSFDELAEYARNEYDISVSINTEGMAADELASQFENLSAKIYNTATAVRRMQLAFEDNKSLLGLQNRGFGFGQAGEKDLKQFADTYSGFVASMSDVVEDGYKRADESEMQYIQRLIDGYAESDKNGLINGAHRRLMNKFERRQEEALKEWQDILEESGIDANTDPELIRTVIEQTAIEKQIPALTDWLIAKAEEEFGITIPVEVEFKPDTMSGWQKGYAELFAPDKLEDISLPLPKWITDVFGEISLEDAKEKVLQELEEAKAELKVVSSIAKSDWLNTAYGQQAASEGKTQQEVISLLEKEVAVREQVGKYMVALAEDSEDTYKREARSINRRIDLLKDMRSEYEKLSETFTELEAKQRIIDSYAETFADAMAGTGKAISDYDFTEDAGLLEMLKALRPFAAQEGREISLLLAKEISSTQATMDVEIRTVQNEQVLQSIEDLFTGYEVGLQLEELNIPPELAKELFGLDSIDLDSLRAQVASKLPLLTGDEALKQHEEYLKKIDEMEEKAQMERVKKYSEYLLKSNNEFVTAQLEALRQLREIDQTFTDPAQREAARGGVLRELNEKEQKMQWDSFQSSDMYIMMFEDIENMGTKAIEILLNRLQDLRSNLTDLPPSDLKEIVNQINKLETELATRNPFTSIRDTIKEINSLGDIGALQEQIAALSDRQEIIKAQLDAYSTVSQASEKGLTVDAGTASWQSYVQLMSDASESGKTLEEYVAQITQESEDNVKNLNDATDELNKQTQASKKIEAAIANYNANLEAIRTMYSSITEVAEAFGEETDGSLNTIIETGFALGELVSKYLEWKTAQAAGNAAKNLASGPLGWVVLAVQALMFIISLVAKLSENRKAKRIENIRKECERLNSAMEDLKEAIDAAFSLSQLEDYSEQTKANIDQQIRLQKQIIALREKGHISKKDRREINAAKEEIEALEKEKEEILRDLVSTATAGILDNTLDAARGFVDAWYDAFQETGDGMKGLETNFQEMLVNMLKQQATLGIAGAFADRWKQELTKYVNADDLTLTASEAQQWVETVKKDFPEFAAALEAYFEALRSVGVEIGDAGELSTLQRGIQGITETQADVIAAYLNSLRFFVQQGNQDRLNFFASFSNPDTPNPILSQLKAIAKNTEAIYTLLESVSITNHPKGGAGIKVFID